MVSTYTFHLPIFIMNTSSVLAHLILNSLLNNLKKLGLVGDACVQALGKQKQENQKFTVILSYRVKLRLAWAM